MYHQSRQGGTQARHDLFRQPNHRVHIWAVSKAPDKHNILTACCTVICIQHIRKQVCGNCLYIDLRCNSVDFLLLHNGRVVRYIRLTHQCQFFFLPLDGILKVALVACQFILSVFPQEMQIVSVICDKRLCVLSDFVNVLHRNVRAV